MLQGASPALEEALMEILLLSDADLFVGTFSSFFGQLALHLALARTQGFCHRVTLLDNAATDRPPLFLLPEQALLQQALRPVGEGKLRTPASSTAANCSGGTVLCDCVEVVPQSDKVPLMDSADYGIVDMHAVGIARFTRRSPRSTSIDTLCTILADDGMMQVERLLRIITRTAFNQRLRIINYVANPEWGACNSSASRARLVPSS